MPYLFDRIYFRLLHLLVLAGFNFYQRSEDRRILEQVVFPYLMSMKDCSRILFVGCDWYTRGYNKIFRDDKKLWTMDVDCEKRIYGAKRHIIDSFANIQRHFPPASLDLILCNGVFGWGLNDKPETEQAVHGSHICLREGGVFLLGWNDVPENRPFLLSEIESLQLFNPYVFPPLNTACFLTETENRHTFNFYEKRENRIC